MTPEQFEENINSHFANNSEKQKVRNVTTALIKILNIPLDNSLIYLFGNGEEKDNKEALENWVSIELKKFPEDIGDPLDYLFAKFRCELGKHSIYK